MDDVQCVEHRFHGRVRAPQRSPKPDREGKAQGVGALGGDSCELLTCDINRSPRQKSAHLIEVLGYRRWVREKAIDRNERRDGRKNCKNAVVGHPGSECQNAVLGNVCVDAQENVLPSAQRYLRRSSGLAASVSFTRLYLIGGRRNYRRTRSRGWQCPPFGLPGSAVIG